MLLVGFLLLSVVVFDGSIGNCGGGGGVCNWCGKKKSFRQIQITLNMCNWSFLKVEYKKGSLSE